MRVLKYVTCFLNWLVVIVLAASAVIWVLWDFIGKEGAVISRHGQVLLIVSGLVLLVLNLILVWDSLSKAFGADYLKLEGTGGRVSISIRALQEALERAVREISEVTSARVKVSDPAKKGKPVVIRAYVRLKGRVVYHSISRAIINRLETTFGEIVSEGPQAQCHVLWEKISPDRAASPAGPAPSASLRPRFPVEQDKEG